MSSAFMLICNKCNGEGRTEIHQLRSLGKQTEEPYYTIKDRRKKTTICSKCNGTGKLKGICTLNDLNKRK